MGILAGEQMPELSQTRPRIQDDLWEGPPRGSRAPARLPPPHLPVLQPLLAACLGGGLLDWGLHEALRAGGIVLLGAGENEFP